MRPSPRAAALGALAGGAALAYPLGVAHALSLWGVRAVAAALFGAGILSLVVARTFEADGADERASLPRPAPLARAALLALPALAAATGAPVFLRLVPAGILALLARVFLDSLRGGSSILQEAARRMHPYAPGFIGPYCRKTTVAFAALFALQATALAALALRPPSQGWAAASSAALWIPPLVVSALEWAVRKATFRYYGPGPVDRLLRRLLPPEKTARGRRSLEYMRRMRRELGLPPP